MSLVTGAGHRQTSRDQVRAGVVGAGYFGRFHAQKYRDHDDSVLMAIVDPKTDQLVDVASEMHAQAYGDIACMLDLVDVATIATPATTHFQIAETLLKAGKHVLLEKPIATTIEDAQKLIDLADEQGLVLQIGHQERYVFASSGLLDIPAKPKKIVSKRHGPFSGRNTDCCAAMDLMVHDFDMIHALNGSQVGRIQANGRSVKTPHADEVSATIELEDGCIIDISASRIARERERSMQLVFEDGEVEIDFVNRAVKNTTDFTLSDLFGESSKNDPAIGDPLGYGVDRFLNSVKSGEAPMIRPQEAQRALQTVLAVTDAMVLS